ncbi:MAG: hypothetical protein F7O42_00835 [Opitutae bacterium]|nr:hypothetical protein [Opitutae bacterium]
MNRPWLPLIWSISLLAWPIWIAGQELPLMVVGSHYVKDILGYDSSEEQESIAYRMTSSLLGDMKIREGLADVAFVIQSSEAHPSTPGTANILLGFWGVFFAVHRDNPLTEVPLNRLSELLRNTRHGLNSKWGFLLPGEPDWTNRPLLVTFGLTEEDPSYPVLNHWFFQDEKVAEFGSLGENPADPFGAGSSALLVLPQLPEVDQGLRLLSLVQPGDSVGFLPSQENLFFGDYPLRCSLHLIARDISEPRTRRFLAEFFQSGDLEKLGNSGFVVVPANVRNQALLEFDLEF